MKSRDSTKTVTEANTPSGTDTKGKPQKRTRHRRRNEIKEEKGNNSRGRKKTGENLKKKVDTVSDTMPSKPVIESSNPFFIAVCAPETYKPRITSSSSLGMISSTGDKDDGGGQRNNRTNVFLRQRTRGGPTAPATQNTTLSSSNIHSNRFIHHPALQHSREIQSHSNTSESSTREIRLDTKINNNGLELSNEVQFPSLGSSATNATSATSATKLNFKEMVMRNSSSSETANNTSDVIPSVHATHTTHVTVVSTTRIPPPLIHKSLSTNNIFLAAFRSHDEEDYEGDQGDQGDQGDREVVYSSSAGLIDSCDKKYDRLYK